MDKITLQEIEMLGALLQRAGMSYYEVCWVNAILAKLRAQAEESSDETPDPPTPEEN